MARQYMMDPTVPRPAPRIPIMPTPFTFEKPSPQVPDLSLIFDSSSSGHQSSHHPRNVHTPEQQQKQQQQTPQGNSSKLCSNDSTTNSHNVSNSNPMSFEIQVMYDIMRRQEEIITRIDEKINRVADKQDAQFNIIHSMLQSLIEKSNSQRERAHCSTMEKEIQTDKLSTTITTTTTNMAAERDDNMIVHKPIHNYNSSNNNSIPSSNNTNNQKRKSSPLAQQNHAMQNAIGTEKLPNIERSRSASGSSSSSTSSSLTSTQNSTKNSSNNNNSNNNNNNSNNNNNPVISQPNHGNTTRNSFPPPRENKNLLQVSDQHHNYGLFNQTQPRGPFGNADFQFDHNPEDFSGMLKDLQLPTIREASLFSEASIQPIDLQGYNDSLNGSGSESPRLGPSASAYGSSDDDDDEVVQPTPTFYQNIIGNVNKMLENNRAEPTLYGSTDTTVYGMSSSNLSFATKEYLQRYGLVKPKKPATNGNGKQPRQQYPENNRIFSNEEGPASGNNNRILDMTTLRNQPKLL